MSDANRTQFGLVKEVTFDVIPATPAFETLRTTGGSLQYTPRSVVSAELRADRQITDLIRVGFEAGGSIPFEVSSRVIDSILEGALYSTWNARFLTKANAVSDSPITAVDATADTYAFTGGEVVVAGELFKASGFNSSANNGIFPAIAGSGAGLLKTANGRVDEAVVPAGARLKKVGEEYAAGVIAAGAGGVLTRSAGSWATLGIVPGDWIKIGGGVAGQQFIGTPANNGWARVATVAAGQLTFDVYPTGWAADTAVAQTIRIFYGDYIRNGVTAASFSLEEQFQDLGVPEFHYFSGMRVSTLALEAAAQSILTGTATFMGASASVTTARFAGATDIAAPTGDVLNTSSNVGRIAEAGADIVAGPNYVLGLGLEINNNLRRNNALGTPGSFAIGAGRVAVTGRLGTYYASKALLDKLRNNTATSYDARFVDPDGSAALVLDLPRVKFGTGDPTVPGVDTDRMLDLTFQALRHATLGHTIQFQRFEGIE